jgi:selenide,water dikinase
VQTVDFFTPIVDDPFTYGQIAAANSLSDVYAMGGRPLTALAICGMPVDEVDNETINLILKGGAEKAKEAHCALAGGHSIKNPEPIYGLSCTGIVHPDRMITNAAAKPGDVLVLTKPLGTGILTTAIKRGLAGDDLVNRGVELMSTLNTVGAILADKSLVKCATDVTGFGLLGHLKSLCESSGVTAELTANDIPTIDPEIIRLIEEEECVPGGTKGNLETVEPFLKWGAGVSDAMKFLLADAQTSGGLLCCVPPENLDEVLGIFESEKTLSRSVIGKILPSDESGTLISVS